MKIAFDAYSAFHSSNELGIHARNIIRSLTHHLKDEHYLLFTYGKGKYPIQDFSSKESFVELIRPSGRFNLLFPKYFRSVGLGKIVSGHKVEVFHGISNFMPAAFPPEVKALRLLSVNSTEKLRFTEDYTIFRNLKNTVAAWRNISRSAHFIVNSDYDRQFLQQKFRIKDARLHVVAPALHPQFFSDELLIPDKSSAFYYLPKTFILCTSKLSNSKIAESLIRAAYLDRNQDGLALVFAGRSHRNADHLKALVKKLNIEDRVYFVDGVSTGMMVFLYRRASLVVHPVRYESSAIPVLEAMSCNIPVVASDLPVFRQYCGDHIHYFNEDSPEEIHSWMKRFREQPEFFSQRTSQAREHANTFTPAKFAEQLFQTYRDSK